MKEEEIDIEETITAVLLQIGKEYGIEFSRADHARDESYQLGIGLEIWGFKLIRLYRWGVASYQFESGFIRDEDETKLKDDLRIAIELLRDKAD